MSRTPATGGTPAAAGRRVTITDVARAAGVSIAVVSYALNGRQGVSDSTRRHVLKVAADLDWRPSAAARSMRSAAVTSVGLQVLDGVGASHSRSAGLDLASGLRAVLGTVALSVEVAADRATGATDLERDLSERRHTAFVVQDLLLDDPRTRAAARVGARVVGVTPPGLGTAGIERGVWFDGDAEAAVGRYLVDLGHRRLVLLVADADGDVARALHAGLLTATAGLVATVDVVEAASAPAAGAAAARFLADDQRPTAVVTDGDVTALAVLEAARHRGLEVPWDVSVVSGADAETCRLVDPQLTAVGRPWHDLAATVASALRIAPQPPAGVPSARLVIRGTTAPPPSTGLP
ncbi:DNA-binding LacI/PurR family transcriptional regulator [Isoptericola sp. CG 20/1183]|uniref:DNA-binding LacI/PurR family transcriptional regulator n=1 Tax=Isoptericola halotolerans TaxID=300560 RepID=A0ABX5EHZ2_9MICO|nr:MULTISPECIES: LacI family DNA-binding transcriptional regulator [Isoptericola]PRZ07579.1 DNA-binding LacI/PurR family transcriptional regulator [Isoptericola halotolerans]PRZ08061.1 DNA-binding LacI/PurR family transcriptional regulator [Isoptericola sp. CG 20/1183]